MKHHPSTKASSNFVTNTAAAGDSSKNAPRIRQLARDQHRASVEKELEDDEKKLRELEEKLAEVFKIIHN